MFVKPMHVLRVSNRSTRVSCRRGRRARDAKYKSAPCAAAGTTQWMSKSGCG